MAKTILPLPTIPTAGVPALDETAAADNATFQAAATTKAGSRLHHKAIKLTFVPNQYCNLGCSYCYLGDLTENKDNPSDVVSQFNRIANHLNHQGILISSLLLHGAEISTLPASVLRDLFNAYTEYRSKYRLQIKALGSNGAAIHIKTNLYNFDKLKPLYEEFEVSISGSFDLPFSLHEKLRTTKAGKSTLKRTINNVLLLAEYPFRKQISCVVGKEHLERIDEFIHDIEWLDEHGFDMVTDFYIMFSYDSVKSDYTSQLNQQEMVEFFEALRLHFEGTKFEQAIYYEWFKEFTHGYCTNQINCGTNNFLVQKDGDVYPCHRGQAEPDLKFGNILQLGMPELITRGGDTIRAYERANPALSSDCISCEYFYLCHAGCPIQRNNTQQDKAYTCGIQKALYRAQPHRFPPKPEVSRRLVDSFIRQNQPRIYDDLSVPRVIEFNPELFEEKNSITSIINRDSNLATLFRKGAIRLHVNEASCDLFSSRLYGRITQANISPSDSIQVFVADDIWALNAGDGAINAVRVQLLRDNLVVYGDEARTKMEHVATTDFYAAELTRAEGGWILDLTGFFNQYAHTFLPDYGNLLSITTIKAREYHYAKHAKNAFYHLETVNLPFHEFRFGWMPDPSIDIQAT